VGEGKVGGEGEERGRRASARARKSAPTRAPVKESERERMSSRGKGGAQGIPTNTFETH
jgi:hypothetical protein